MKQKKKQKKKSLLTKMLGKLLFGGVVWLVKKVLEPIPALQSLVSGAVLIFA